MMRQYLRARRLAMISFGLGWMLGVTGIPAPARAGDMFLSTSLATSATDKQLINPWGISSSPMGPFWISDNGAAASTLYSVDPNNNAVTKLMFPTPTGVTIPGDGSVTGQTFNPGSAFNGSHFLFVSEDGTISGWQSGGLALVLQSPDPANIYKGTTLVTVGGHSYLLSANFGTGKIDVFKGDTSAPNLPGNFVDPNLAASFAPFNIAKLGNTVYVTYALKNGKDDVPGDGNGFVTAFTQDGTLIGRIAAHGVLNSPWGLALAPSGFGSFAGDLLVGNFGNGEINVFNPDPSSPGLLGHLTDAKTGNALAIKGLWGLIVGNGKSAGNVHDIYFTAGPDDEKGGVLGVIQSVPEPGSGVLAIIAIGAISAGLAWKNCPRYATS
jgi:uncharacterized protein (TIGR03118 family)